MATTRNRVRRRTTERPHIVAGDAWRRLDTCTCFNLRKAARAVTQAYDAALQPTGLRATQFSVLAMTAQTGPVSLGRLAEQLVMDRTTLTRNLAPLIRQGLLSVGSGEDRRARIVAITPAGRAALGAARPLWQGAQERMVRGLGLAPWRSLLGGLAAAVDAARDD